MTTDKKRQITVFVSSSLSHEKSRLRIKKALESRNEELAQGDSPIEIQCKLHEFDGKSGITPGVPSQEFINAFAEGCNAFILYAGDFIGEFTCNEYEYALANMRRNYHFIFVVYNPKDKVVKQPKTEYYSWEEFRTKYLKPDPSLEYYHKQTTPDTLERTFGEIRDEMINCSLVPLSPADMDYGRMLSSMQQRYRQSGTFYLHRGIDNDVEAFLKNKESFFGIVTGMSLAGKTRVVIENLKKLSPEGLKIHYLSSDAEAKTIFGELNFKTQFPKELRHILFIDEIDSWVNDSGNNILLERFAELCQFATVHPGALTVIATMHTSFPDFIDNLRKTASSALWLDRIVEMPILPMSLSEVWTEYRKLKILNQIRDFDTRRIREGLPLGALFIDLGRLQNIYNTLVRRDRYAKLVFDAIKTVWLWKNKSRNDPSFLLDFINGAGYLRNKIDDDKLLDTLKLLMELISIREDEFSLDYTYETEDVLVDEVFRFMGQTDDNADECYSRAVDRIIAYIDKYQPDNRFECFSKLCMRIRRRTNMPGLYIYTVGQISARYPLEQLKGYKEEIAMMDGLTQDCVRRWFGELVHCAVEQGDIDESRHLYEVSCRNFDGDFSDWVLAVVLSVPENREYYRPTVCPAGKIAPALRKTRSSSLLAQLIDMTDYYDALDVFSEADFDTMVKATISKDAYNDLLFEKKLKSIVSSCFCPLLYKATSFSQFQTALFYLEAKNGSREKFEIFKSKADMLFEFIRPKAWMIFSDAITSFDLPKVFDYLVDVQVPDGREYDILRLNKGLAMNSLLKPMQLVNAIAAWNKMGALRDSYTLMTMIDKCPDFAMAFAFTDALRMDNDKIKLSQDFANKLIDTTATKAELAECQKQLQRLGFISEDDVSRADKLGVPPCWLNGEEVAVSSLVQKEFLVLETIVKLMKLTRPTTEGLIRQDSTLCSFIKRRDVNFEYAYNILYIPNDIVTLPEQAYMQSQPVAISILINKAKKPEDLDWVHATIEKLIQDANPGEGILHKDHNIISMYLRNARIVNTYDDGLAFIKRIETKTGSRLKSAFIDRCLLNLLWRYDRYVDMSTKIEITNHYIMERTADPRKDLRALISKRNYKIDNSQHNLCDISCLSDVEPFPYIDADGRWSIREYERYDFLINMMNHRFMHPVSLKNLLAILANAAMKNPDGILSYKNKCKKLLDRANKTGLFIDHESMVFVRSLMEKAFGSKEFEEALIAITGDYSIYKDLFYQLHDKSKEGITIEEANTRIRKFEKDKSFRLPKTSGYYDAVIDCLTKDESQTVDSLLKYRSENIPADVPLTQEQKYFMMHKVRSVDDLEKLRSVFGKLPEGWQETMITVLKGLDFESEERRKLVRHILGLEGDSNLMSKPLYDVRRYPASLSIGIYVKLPKVGFESLKNFVTVNHLELDDLAFQFFALKVSNTEQLRAMESLEGFRWTNHVAAPLVSSINDKARGKVLAAVIDEIRSRLLPELKDIHRKEMLEKGKQKLHKECSKIYRSVSYSSSKEQVQFAELCWDIINHNP